MTWCGCFTSWGDVHQPLHATSRFTQDEPQGDAGGNAVMITCSNNCGATELHAFWDGLFGPGNNPQDAIDGAPQLANPDPQLAAIADEAVWIQESFQAAQASVYVPPIDQGSPPFALDNQYLAKALTIAQQRVALAGVRLANLLEQNLR